MAPVWIKMIDRLTAGKLHRPLSCLSQALSVRRRIYTAHNQNPFDIIQAASYRAIGLFSPRKVPLVIRISSFEPQWRRALNIPCTLSQKATEQLELLTVLRATAAYAPSTRLANEISQILKKKIDVIRPPFTTEVESRDRRFFETEFRGTDYLLFFGTISPLKGGLTIAEVLPSILKNHPELHVVFIGKSQNYGDRPLIGHIFQKAGPYKKRVRHFSPVPHSELYPVIQNARGVLLPSIADNFPNTCMEAMALNQIVIGTVGSSMEELITDGENGFLCRPGNPQSLLETIEKVMKLSETEEQKIKRNAGQRIKALAPELTIPPLINYYKEAIRKSRH